MAHLPDPSLNALRDSILAAVADGSRLRIRGGGSKNGLCTATADAAVLDTRACCGILSHEPGELVLTARAGTPLAEVEAALAEHGQALAFEPPRLGAEGRTSGTLGGAVASGLNGPARASAGALRDFVLGVQALNGKGEALTFGGQVMKNVAGYDISRLLAGSWGNLAVLTEISLKVLPVAPAEATLQFALPQQAALDLLHSWGAQPLPLHASRWQQHAEGPLLHLRLRGARAAVDAAVQMMTSNHAATLPDQAEAVAGWTACRDQRLAFFTRTPASGHGLWRLSVPQVTPAFDLPWSTLVEWHGGQRWLWAPCDAATAASMHALAASVGGHAMLWQLPAQEAAQDCTRHAPLPDVLQRIHHQLKQAFDPHGVFAGGQPF